MKKLLFAVALLCASVFALAQDTNNKLPVDAGTLRSNGQVSAQSTSFFMDEKGLNFLYLHDGFDSYAAISYTVAPIAGTNGRLRLQALGAADPSDMNNKAYLTLGLGYNLFNSASGFRLDLFAGPKGFNVTDNFKFESGKNGWVFGVGFSAPLGN